MDNQEMEALSTQYRRQVQKNFLCSLKWIKNKIHLLYTILIKHEFKWYQPNLKISFKTFWYSYAQDIIFNDAKLMSLRNGFTMLAILERFISRQLTSLIFEFISNVKWKVYLPSEIKWLNYKPLSFHVTVTVFSTFVFECVLSKLQIVSAHFNILSCSVVRLQNMSQQLYC